MLITSSDVVHVRSKILTCNALERRGSDLFQPEQQPPHSEWSRCYRQSSDTGLREPPESQSGPKMEYTDTWTGSRGEEDNNQRDLQQTGWEDVRLSEQWCGYSQLSWPQPVASPPGLSSSRKSGQTCLWRKRLSQSQWKLKGHKGQVLCWGREEWWTTLNTKISPFYKVDVQ